MRVWLFILFFLGAVLVGAFVSPSDVEHFVVMHRALSETQGIAITMLFVAVYVVSFAFTIPITTVLALGAGVMFGFLQGILLVTFSTLLGALSIFYGARIKFRTACERLLGDKLMKLVEEAEAHPVSFMLSTRFAPLVPFPVAHLVPALAMVRTRDFIWTTVAGTVPASVAFVAIGHSFMHVAMEMMNEMPKQNYTGLAVIVLSGLSIVVLLPVWWRWYKKRLK